MPKIKVVLLENGGMQAMVLPNRYQEYPVQTAYISDGMDVPASLAKLAEDQKQARDRLQSMQAARKA